CCILLSVLRLGPTRLGGVALGFRVTICHRISLRTTPWLGHRCLCSKCYRVLYGSLTTQGPTLFKRRTHPYGCRI
ncbi:hypothetical protein Godav_029164, partial [Gossypium davidsonii]|nr:hypothetical protein [Gossypium davidsonii]